MICSLLMKDVLPHEQSVVDFAKTLERLKEQNLIQPVLSVEELKELELKLDQLKEKVYLSLNAWERVQICRHPNRPRSIDYIQQITEEFINLAGDRSFRDDPAVMGGFARIGGERCMIIGQEKGCNTESRLHRNFGMLHPEGFRKALRLALLAEKFGLPVLFLVDTPGAYAGLTAEERGQGQAIAYNLRELFRLRVPILVLIIGEGCSGGALGMGVGDTVAMLEHSYYSVISPEACASILWKDPTKKEQAAEILKMHPEFLLELGIIDAVIKEPLGGAHHAPEEVYKNVKSFILDQWRALSQVPLEELLERRYQKFRKMGQIEIHETLIARSPPQS